MQRVSLALLLFVPFATVITIIACIAVRHRKRWRAQSTIEKRWQKAEKTRHETQNETRHETEDGSHYGIEQAAACMVVGDAERLPAAEECELGAEAEPAPEIEVEPGPELGIEVESEPALEEVGPQSAPEPASKQLEPGKNKRLKLSMSKRLEPAKRGGRPRTPIREHEKRLTREVAQDSVLQETAAQEGVVQEPRPCSITPEIVCLKMGRKWIPAVEVPEDLLQNADLSVLHDGVPLSPDEAPLPLEEFAQGCWPLKQVCGEVAVQWNGDESFRLALGQEDCLLFKLSGKSQKEGRRVKFPSSGSYLAIVPESWERDDVRSGPPPAAPELVSLAGYRAHFFDLDQSGKKIAFRTPGGPFEIKPKAVRFVLAGNQLTDATEGMGPLFGQAPPRIRALGAQHWKDIKTIVVGEEGGGKGKWRMAFHPDPEPNEQVLPHEVATRKGGWYFLRFYDPHDDLVESLDFRFLSPLKEIKISQPPPLPYEGGHKPVCVEFSHESGCVVRVERNMQSEIVDHNIQYEHDKTILTFPADSAYDETCWSVSFGDGPEVAQVEVTILVERVWWAVGEENALPSEWGDKPVAMARSDFAAISRKTLWLRLPRSHRVDKVFVGFKRSKARFYNIKPGNAKATDIKATNITATGQMVAVPLRDFCDCPELQTIGTISLRLWIPFQKTIYEGTPGRLTNKLYCTSCGFDTFSEEEMLSHVRTLHMTGFFRPLSYEEIRERFPSLPPGIYLCSYCNYYVKSDNPDNPTSTISRHIEKECTGVSHNAGLKQVRFRTIYDVDEIRKHVIHNLPRIYRCLLCSCESDTEDDMKSHLIESHKNNLCELR